MQALLHLTPSPECNFAAVIVVQRRKLGMLNFSAAAGMDTNAVLLLYLIAAADPQEPVSR